MSWNRIVFILVHTVHTQTHRDFICSHFSESSQMFKEIYAKAAIQIENSSRSGEEMLKSLFHGKQNDFFPFAVFIESGKRKINSTFGIE